MRKVEIKSLISTTVRSEYRGAEAILSTCLGLKEHETFLLIYDETSRDFIQFFGRAAKKLRIGFRRAFVPAQRQARGPDAFGWRLERALSGAHGVLMATTDDARCTSFRITLTGTKRKADCAIATMPGASLSILASAIDIDYQKIISRCRHMTLPLVTGRSCELQTFDKQGNRYSLHFALAGAKRPPIQSYGIIARGAWGNVPAGETFIAPLEDSANGEYLVTGVVGKEIIRNKQGALLLFKNGRLIKHSYLSNGQPVRYLTQLEELARQNGQQSCWNVIAEFGVGMNESIRTLTGVQLVDEKAYGSVHIAIGHNKGYGGATNCGSVHCDITTMRPSVFIDKELIIDRGVHIAVSDRYTPNFRRHSNALDDKWSANDTLVYLNDDSYEIDAAQWLLVKKKTSSGRYSIYALGDEETSRLAGRLVDMFQGELAAQSRHLQEEMQLTDSDWVDLLTVLMQAGIIRS
jgi:leucyl aminopeptidase (aminopeptidase T)